MNFNQRSGMNQEVQIQNFGGRRRFRINVFIFKKFKGAYTVRVYTNIFCEIWHEASFYETKGKGQTGVFDG